MGLLENNHSIEVAICLVGLGSIKAKNAKMLEHANGNTKWKGFAMLETA